MKTPKPDLNMLAKQIFNANVARGWWADMDRNFYQTLQLVNTEIAEATEGERKNLMDDHLPTRKMGEVELADAFIRLADLAGRYGWEYYEPSFEPGDEPTPFAIGNWHARLCAQKFKHMPPIAEQHFWLTECVIRLGTIGGQLDTASYVSAFSSEYSGAVNSIMKVAHNQGYDLWGAVFEKLAYNAERADHKPEARAAEHGKKF